MDNTNPTSARENTQRWTGWRRAVEAGYPQAESYDYWLHPDTRIPADALPAALAAQAH